MGKASQVLYYNEERPMRKLHREAWFLLAGAAFVLAFMGAAVLWPFATLSHLAIVAAVIRGALILFMGSMVIFMGDRLSYVERLGLGLAMGCMIMTTQSLLMPETPWDAWASVGSGLGFLIYFTAKAGPDMWSRIAGLVK